MLDDLDFAAHQSADPPQVTRPPVIQAVHTGRPGRPRYEIDPEWLEFALDLRSTTGVAQALGVSARTVHRNALDLHLATPGAPPFQTVVSSAGESQYVHTTTTPPVSTFSDEQLDIAVTAILTVFPDIGRSMLSGCLKAQGQRVPMERIQASYDRVHGSPALFGDRRIVRKEYKVAGPLSLAHMDGQHGMST